MEIANNRFFIVYLYTVQFCCIYALHKNNKKKIDVDANEFGITAFCSKN